MPPRLRRPLPCPWEKRLFANGAFIKAMKPPPMTKRPRPGPFSTVDAAPPAGFPKNRNAAVRRVEPYPFTSVRASVSSPLQGRQIEGRCRTVRRVTFATTLEAFAVQFPVHRARPFPAGCPDRPAQHIRTAERKDEEHFRRPHIMPSRRARLRITSSSGTCRSAPGSSPPESAL